MAEQDGDQPFGVAAAVVDAHGKASIYTNVFDTRNAADAISRARSDIVASGGRTDDVYAIDIPRGGSMAAAIVMDKAGRVAVFQSTFESGTPPEQVRKAALAEI